MYEKKQEGQVAGRFSEKRDAIIKNLKSRTDHPSADTLYADLRKEYPNISMGTVYRNLSELSDKGEILKLGAPERERYDGNTSPHNHFFCDKCGKITDICSAISLAGLSSAEKELGGKITSASITFHGICEKCLNKNK